MNDNVLNHLHQHILLRQTPLSQQKKTAFRACVIDLPKEEFPLDTGSVVSQPIQLSTRVQRKCLRYRELRWAVRALTSPRETDVQGLRQPGQRSVKSTTSILLTVFGFSLDHRDHPFSHIDWRDQQFTIGFLARISCQEIKQIG